MLIKTNPMFQSKDTQSNKDTKNEFYSQHEHEHALVLVLCTLIQYRVQLNAMPTTRVSDANKLIKPHVIAVKNQVENKKGTPVFPIETLFALQLHLSHGPKNFLKRRNDKVRRQTRSFSFTDRTIYLREANAERK